MHPPGGKAPGQISRAGTRVPLGVICARQMPRTNHSGTLNPAFRAPGLELGYLRAAAHKCLLASGPGCRHRSCGRSPGPAARPRRAVARAWSRVFEGHGRICTMQRPPSVEVTEAMACVKPRFRSLRSHPIADSYRSPGVRVGNRATRRTDRPSPPRVLGDPTAGL